MKDIREFRCKLMAEYIVEQQATIRMAAEVFGVSKTTVHKDLMQLLPKIDKKLYKKFRARMRYNKSVAHMRGGLATKRKYTKVNR